MLYIFGGKCSYINRFMIRMFKLLCMVKKGRFFKYCGYNDSILCVIKLYKKSDVLIIR